MVLRIPETVNDARLLEDEPFNKHFTDEINSKRALRPVRNTRLELFINIEEAMRREIRGLDAARVWLRTVFSREPDLTSEDLDVFTNFYWSMHKGDGDRTLRTLLHETSKAHALSYRCPLDKTAVVQSHEDQQASNHCQATEAHDLKQKPEKPRRKRTRSSKRHKNELQDAYDGEPEDNDFTPGSNVSGLDASVSAPATTVLSQSRLPVTSSSAVVGEEPCMFTSVSAPVAVPKRNRKRKAKKPPSSNADPFGDSPLSSLPSDSEPSSTPPKDTVKEPLAFVDQEAVDALPLPQSQNSSSNCEVVSTPLSPPAMSQPQRPIRNASNRGQLSRIMAWETEYAEKGELDIFEVDAELKLVTPARKVPTKSTVLAGKKMPGRRIPTAKVKLDLESKLSGPLKRVTAPTIVRRKSLRPSRRAARAQKPRPDVNVEPVESRPGKKRRGNDGDVLVSATATDSASAPTKPGRGRPRKTVVPLPTPPRGSATPRAKKASKPKLTAIITSVPPATDVAPEAQEKPRGRKRAREQELAEQPQSPQITGKPQERLTITIRPRRLAAAKATALNAQYAQVTAAFEKQRSALPHQSCQDPEASDWEADPDDPQPGESSDEDTPPSVSVELRKAVSKQAAASSPEMANLTEMVPLHAAPVLEEGEIDESVDVGNAKTLDEQCKLAYPHLILCPLLDSSPVNQLIVSKLPLLRLPPIWAQSRQEVCESFDWFRSYQGGVYFVKDIVKGYLLSAFSASRDLFHRGGKLIISHGGGKAAQSLGRAPGTAQASDQREEDKSVRALLHNYRTGRPLVLIIDDKYSLFPYDLAAKGVTYAVLGWYQIAHAWAEYQSDASSPTGKVVRWKFAFQWCDAQGLPWWSTPGPTADTPTALPYEPEPMPEAMAEIHVQSEQTCEHCKLQSPQVYDAGWMCLKPKCLAFWSLTNVTETPTSLNYAGSFLRPVTMETNQILEDLRPGLPVAGAPTDCITTSRHFCKGFHCIQCGRLSSRYKWEHWECRSCSNRYVVPGRLRVASEFRNQKSLKMDRHTHHPSLIMSRLARIESGKSFGTRVTFILPHGRGFIHALFAGPSMNQEADAILQEYQEQASDGQLKFRRWPLRSHKCRGTLLTNYFSQNTGEPYQYVGGDENTVPFDRAPSAVNRALSLIKQRIEEAKVDIPPTFNEVLTAAYMEKQKMAFHSDAEKGLGPNVASLSLGAAAHMHFRLHAQYAGAEMGPSESREILTLFLKHGDVVVMQGADIQKYYEHTVIPMNFRIAATARLIGREHQGA